MIKLREMTAAAILAGALVAGTGAVQAAEPTRPGIADIAGQAYPGESYTQYRRYGRYGGRGYYGGGRGYRRGYGGAAAAGIVGLAAGALVAGAIASSATPAYGYPGQPVGNVYGHDPNWVSYCASRYRSFDPASGTYLSNDGNRYYCQ